MTPMIFNITKDTVSAVTNRETRNLESKTQSLRDRLCIPKDLKLMPMHVAKSKAANTVVAQKSADKKTHKR